MTSNETNNECAQRPKIGSWITLVSLLTVLFLAVAVCLWPHDPQIHATLGEVFPSYEVHYTMPVTFNSTADGERLYFAYFVIETDSGETFPFVSSGPVDHLMTAAKPVSETFVLGPCPDFSTTSKRIRLRFDLTTPFKGRSLYNRFFDFIFMLSDNRPNWSYRDDDPPKTPIWSQWVETAGLKRKTTSQNAKGEQNGCRQLLVWHLSCHRRFPLAVA